MIRDKRCIDTFYSFSGRQLSSDDLRMSRQRPLLLAEVSARGKMLE